MKKFLKIFSITLISLVSLLYLAFLFVLPNCIDLNKYEPQIKKAVFDSTGFIVNTESLDKVVENLVDTIVSEHDIETHKILSRFGHTLTYRQAQIYKSERTFFDKIFRQIHIKVNRL